MTTSTAAPPEPDLFIRDEAVAWILGDHMNAPHVVTHERPALRVIAGGKR